MEGFEMVNWSLLPETQDEPTEVVTEPVATEEASETVEAPTQWDEVTKRIAVLEEANKHAEVLSTDLRRSVGRVQSILDRMETATGKTRADLEASLDEKFSELSGLLEDVSGNIDTAILPDSVKEKVRSARQQAAQRSAAVNIDKLVQEKVQAMLPVPTPTNDVPADWRLFEREMEATIKSAGLDPDNKEIFDWQYAGYLLSQGRKDAAKLYFDTTIDANAPKTKLQAAKDAAVESPTGAGAGAAKQWHEKLGDKNISLDDKRKMLRDAGVLR